MEKREFKTIAEKKRVANNIITEALTRDAFLLLGHTDPDTDCVASLASFGLLLRKYQKDVSIYLPGPLAEQFSYLVAICKYNGITVCYGNDSLSEDIQVLVILDTPKPGMIALNPAISALMADPKIRRMEVDHHLEADAEYAGDPGYCLVTAASSTCELIGYMCLKLVYQQGLKEDEFFSRNIILALLTGIVGDSHMGKYLKSRKERYYYQLFSTMFDRLLIEKTDKNSRNISSMEGIFDVIQRFSVREKRCFERISEQKQKSRSIYYVALDEDESADLFKQYDSELIINVAKAVADTLAEESGRLGLVSLYDSPSLSDYIQFRLRRGSKFLSFDLRNVLETLDISNGGGHPGAIGYRVKKSAVEDINSYIGWMVGQIEEMVDRA